MIYFKRPRLMIAKEKTEMKVVFVDYSETYYSNAAKTDVLDKYAGKFVQIRNDSTEYLILSPKEFIRYHADIVERFCNERGIKGVYNSAIKRFDIHDPAWVVAGGGKFEIDKIKKHLRLYDNSMTYGRFDSKRLREKILSINEFSGFDVNIE